MKHSKTAKAFFTGVVDNDEKLLTGVSDAGNACFADVVDTDETPKKTEYL